jgi:hypothetical protein
MNKPSFRVHFNERKQWADVFIAESPAKFKRRNECHAYYLGADGRKAYRGLFGVIHLSEMNDKPLGVELMAHEIDHLMADWRNSRRITPTVKNEERLATLRGEVEKEFWRKWEKWSGKV